MEISKSPAITIEKHRLQSAELNRKVKVDVYLPPGNSGSCHLLLINDGQNMKEAGLKESLNELYQKKIIKPVCCVAIYAGDDRINEFGIAAQFDYLGRGIKAANYHRFILNELLPFLDSIYNPSSFIDISIAGFSLGGLTALDIGWINPEIFTRIGVFSGSLWWRSISHEDVLYDDKMHRIMHQEIRNGNYGKNLKFFFQCGNMDETQDRNNNGIIDSIDDTRDLVFELQEKGYRAGEDIFYLEMPEGKHDIATWGKALPVFFQWGWGRVM